MLSFIYLIERYLNEQGKLYSKLTINDIVNFKN